MVEVNKINEGIEVVVKDAESLVAENDRDLSKINNDTRTKQSKILKISGSVVDDGRDFQRGHFKIGPYQIEWRNMLVTPVANAVTMTYIKTDLEYIDAPLATGGAYSGVVGRDISQPQCDYTRWTASKELGINFTRINATPSGIVVVIEGLGEY